MYRGALLWLRTGDITFHCVSRMVLLLSQAVSRMTPVTNRCLRTYSSRLPLDDCQAGTVKTAKRCDGCSLTEQSSCWC
jgi:hypothetical protein